MYPISMVQPLSIWRHKKTGGYYFVLALALCTTNGSGDGKEKSVCYRSTKTGKSFYREASEFLDGRFVPVDLGGEELAGAQMG